MQSRVFTYPNATVRVHIPDVAESERQKNFRELKRSAELVLRELIKLEDSKTPLN